eukprot:533433_1
MNGNAGAPKSAAPTPSMSPPSIASISNILIGVIIGIDYLILLPIFIVCVRILYINQKIQVFRSRRPITLKYILFLTFIVFALVEPYRLLDGSIANISLIPYHISSWISSSIEYTFTLGLLLCYAQRSYLIHYDFNYHEAILNNEWKQFTSRHQIQLEWYLKHRNKFGNRTFTTFIIIIIWIILSAFLTALAYHFNIEAHWIIIVLILFAMVEIFQLKLILRMPGLDVFRIRDEYMYLLTIGLTLIIIIFCLLIFYDVNNINQIIISRLIYHLTVMIGTVFISTISIIYPYRVYHSIQKDLNNRDIIRTNSNNKNKKKNKKHSVQRLKKSSAISNSPINKSKSVIEMTG